MSEQEPIIEPGQLTAKKLKLHERFPAFWQLLLLMMVISSLFGGLVVPTWWSQPSVPDRPATNLSHNQGENDFVVVTEITPSANIKAKSVFVYDAATQRVLFQKNADGVLPLASITKLMTALVARELVRDNTPLQVPKSAVNQVSGSGLAWGEVLSSVELRDFAMLASSNDAAYTLASEIGDLLSEDNDGYQAFIEAMNITAEELDLTSFNFKNATGLDLSPTEAGAVGSARDVSFLMQYILKTYPDILEATTVPNSRVYNQTGAYHDADNTNPIINQIPNLLGSKTGYTDLAQGNLTIAFDVGYNHPIIITVLGSTYDDRFSDVLTLVASVQKAFKDSTINQ